jgi:hypothetical protein
MAEYRRLHPQRTRQIASDSYYRNHDRIRAERREWDRTHKAEKAATYRAWQQTHPEHIREYAGRWRAANPELCSFYRRQHEHRLRANGPSDVTREGWAARVAEFGGRCAYCSTPVARPHMDHVDPVSRGGTHTMDNIVPSCRSCNCRKQDKPLLLALLAWRAA